MYITNFLKSECYCKICNWYGNFSVACPECGSEEVYKTPKINEPKEVK